MGLFWTILAVVVALLGVAVIGKGKVEYISEYGKPKVAGIRGLGVVILLIGVGIVGFNSFTIVPSKNVGVSTAFGKVNGPTLSNGWNWVAPWSNIETFDATRQPLKLLGTDDDNGSPIQVRLANNTMATVEVSAEWQIDEKADITQLYLDYRNFENVTTNVVHRRLAAALTSVFEKFDPLKVLKGEASTVTMNDLEVQTRSKLQELLPKGIVIQSLYLPNIKYTDEVQAQINSYINAVNETKIAQQQLQTAQARKEAADALAKGVALSPAVLYQNCLDMVERMVKDGKVLPAAFTCAPPSGTVVSVK